MSDVVFGTRSERAYRRDIVTVTVYDETDLVDVVYHKKLTRAPGWEDVIPGADGFIGALSPMRSGVTSEDEKRLRTLRRVRSVCRDLLYANRWTHWVTLTVDAAKCNRYGFDEIWTRCEKLIKARNRKAGENLRYLLIPERHEDGAYHLHGFIAGFKRGEVVRNGFGHLTIPLFSENLGFDCVKDISHKDMDEYRKILNYTLKYATKSVEDGDTKHNYFRSQGLQGGKTVSLIATDDIKQVIEDMEGFQNEYCKKITLTRGQDYFAEFCGLRNDLSGNG